MLPQKYVEVRYANNSSLRLKHSYSVFRLKRDNKNLSNKEFVENLKTYLGCVRKTKTISVDELSQVISKINGKRNTDGEVPEVQSKESFLKPGEHIAVYWVQETNTFVWYLGIVE